MADLRFCDVADVKSFANVDSAYAEHDTLITQFIVMSTALLQVYTRREWTKKARISYVSSTVIDNYRDIGNNIFKWFSPEIPLDPDTPPTVKYAPGGQFSISEDLSTDLYHVDYDKNQIVIYPGLMKYYQRSIQVAYTAGYEVNDGTGLVAVDQVMKNACIMQAAFMFRRVLDGESGQSQKSNKRGQAQMSLKPSGLIPEVQALARTKVRAFTGN